MQARGMKWETEGMESLWSLCGGRAASATWNPQCEGRQGAW